MPIRVESQVTRLTREFRVLILGLANLSCFLNYSHVGSTKFCVSWTIANLYIKAFGGDRRERGNGGDDIAVLTST
jgi:hypothetical protein